MLKGGSGSIGNALLMMMVVGALIYCAVEVDDVWLVGWLVVAAVVTELLDWSSLVKTLDNAAARRCIGISL